jgi:hypothetical protein
MPQIPKPLAAMIAAARSSIRPHSIDQTARMIVGRRGIRTMPIARVRSQTIPASIRRAGLTHQYLRPLDNGHVRPVSKFPSGLRRPSNQRWEIARLNRATGSSRKPPGYWVNNASELRRLRLGLLARGCLRSARQGAIIAVAIEAPMAAAEEIVAVRRRVKTAKRATIDAGQKVGTAAVAGAAGGVLAFGIAAAGAGPVLGAAAPVLVACAGYHYSRRIVQLIKSPPDSVNHATRKALIARQSLCSYKTFIRTRRPYRPLKQAP